MYRQGLSGSLGTLRGSREYYVAFLPVFLIGLAALFHVAFCQRWLKHATTARKCNMHTLPQARPSWKLGYYPEPNNQMDGLNIGARSSCLFF